MNPHSKPGKSENSISPIPSLSHRLEDPNREARFESRFTLSKAINRVILLSLLTIILYFHFFFLADRSVFPADFFKPLVLYFLVTN